LTIEDFEKLARKRFDYCLNLMIGEKHKEYSRNNDKLHNFKVAGRMKGETPERALIGMEIKQRVSIIDIVNDLDKGELPRLEVLAEKISDEINYMVLLEALIKERILEQGRGFE
jgi:hypothetical protein